MANIFTAQLELIPFTLEIVKAAMIGQAELAAIAPFKILPDWFEPELSEILPALADILEKNPSLTEWFRLIIHQADNTLIGETFLKMIPDATGSLEFGYRIVPSYRRQGYASEAAPAMVNWAFGQPGVQRVMAGCDADNIASKRVLEKIGMQIMETRAQGKMLIWQLHKQDLLQ